MGKVYKILRIVFFTSSLEHSLACSFLEVSVCLLKRVFIMSFGSVINKPAEKVIRNFHRCVIGP